MKKYSFALSLLLTFFLIPCASQAQDSAYARRIIRTLSADKMQGRGASYKGDSIAADFLAAEMSRLGLRPLAPGYKQTYTYNCYSLEGPISLRINGTELTPYTQFRLLNTSRYASPTQLEKASWKRQLKDGTWVIGVKQLDTYSPIVGGYRTDPVCIQVLDSLLPRRVKKVEADLPLHYREDYLSQNVMGYVPGVIDSMIVFTAHYDHCGTMGDGVIFHGAHDNASGVAAVMDLARIAASEKPYYTMVFMLFSGEESGLKGSNYAAEHPPVDFSKVKLLCNIDLFCGGDEGLMVFNANSKQTKPYYDRMVALNQQIHVAPELRPRDNAPNSDHYWFSHYCPSIFILTMGGPFGPYHDPDDTCAACGLAHYHDYLRLILSLTNTF